MDSKDSIAARIHQYWLRTVEEDRAESAPAPVDEQDSDR